MNKDTEEMEPSEKSIVRKRRKGSDSGKVDDDSPTSRSKRKGKVTIEVKFFPLSLPSQSMPVSIYAYIKSDESWSF